MRYEGTRIVAGAIAPRVSIPVVPPWLSLSALSARLHLLYIVVLEMTVTTFSLVLSYVETIHLPYLSSFPLQSGEANYKNCFPDRFEEPGRLSSASRSRMRSECPVPLRTLTLFRIAVGWSARTTFAQCGSFYILFFCLSISVPSTLQKVNAVRHQTNVSCA